MLRHIAALDLRGARYKQYTARRRVASFGAGAAAGVSLGTAARMRFRRYPHVRGAKTYELTMEPRSAYLLRGAMRWNWQHSIPPTPALRYSITFRTAAALDPA